MIAGEEPMLFHIGMCGLFPLVSGAISSALPRLAFTRMV